MEQCHRGLYRTNTLSVQVLETWRANITNWLNGLSKPIHVAWENPGFKQELSHFILCHLYPGEQPCPSDICKAPHCAPPNSSLKPFLAVMPAQWLGGWCAVIIAYHADQYCLIVTLCFPVSLSVCPHLSSPVRLYALRGKGHHFCYVYEKCLVEWAIDPWLGLYVLFQ